ncbi:MAG: RsmD family RNA methyltransferase [Bacteroidales bacterium]
MRIVSGKYKGRHFQADDSLPVRPTTDMAKESLFNILRSRVDFEDLKVLDLFSGIGGISYEFISRGAALVHAIDMNVHCVAFIKSMAEKWDMPNLRVFRQNAFDYPRQCSIGYNLIFADPPYQADNIAQLPDIIFSSSILLENGIFILEHSEKYNFKDHPHFSEVRKYGKVHFSFFF